MRTITLSKLRENIYQIVDAVLKTGEVIEIQRHGKKLKIKPEIEYNKLKALKKRTYLKCKAEEIIHLDWEKEWRSNDLS